MMTDVSQQAEAVKKKYADMGIVVDVRWLDKPTVYGVQVDFTPEEWADICNTNGQLLPSCCANISEVRDEMIGVLRSNGHMFTSELERTYLLLKEHGCQQYDEKHPLGRLIKLWETIKDDCDPVSSREIDLNNPDDAIETVAWLCRAYQAEGIFHEDDEERILQKKACLQYLLIKLVPAISTLSRHLHKIGDTLEGYALYKDGNMVTMGSYRPAIYATKEYAEDMLKEFESYADEIKHIRVSLQNGIELL